MANPSKPASPGRRGVLAAVITLVTLLTQLPAMAMPALPPSDMRLAAASSEFMLAAGNVRVAPAPALRAPVASASVTPAATASSAMPPASGSAAASGSIASPSLPVDEGPKVSITDVRVRGNATVSEETILLTVPIHAGQEVTRTQVMESLQRIYGLGYFLDVRAATEPAAGGERLIFVVVENPVLKAVELEGVTRFPVPELKKPFEAGKGKIINLKDVQAAIKDMEKRYADAGFVLARVVDLQVQPSGTLLIKVAEGKIHDIKITGNDDTKDYVIRREITLKPGQIYNFQQMEGDLRRVYNLNYFEDIGIKYEPVAEDPSQVTVIVTVKEKQTGTVQVSAGWSNRDGPLGILSLRKDNLFGQSQSVSADLTLSQNWSAEVNYFNPWIDDQHTSFGAGLYSRRYYNYFGYAGPVANITSYREDRLGTVLSFGRPMFGEDPVTAQWRYSLRAKIERVGLLAPGAVDYSVPLPALLSGGSTESVFANSLGGTVTFDSRDYVVNPHSGWFNTYSLEQYIPLASPIGMTRLQLDVNNYIPLMWGHTLAFGYKLGSLTGWGGGVPVFERYYSIGSSLIRGWPENPGPAEQTEAKATGQAYSGDSFTLASLEYRFPIVNILSGVVFADTGLFWDQAQNNFSWDRTRSGYGLGIRVSTPLGPLRLDYGMKRWGEAGQIHFSIGQKF